jgi:hypothetical protein
MKSKSHASFFLLKAQLGKLKSTCEKDFFDVTSNEGKNKKENFFKLTSNYIFSQYDMHIHV